MACLGEFFIYGVLKGVKFLLFSGEDLRFKGGVLKVLGLKFAAITHASHTAIIFKSTWF